MRKDVIYNLHALILFCGFIKRDSSEKTKHEQKKTKKINTIKKKNKIKILVKQQIIVKLNF